MSNPIQPNEELQLRAALSRCTTIAEMLNVLHDRYELEVKPGIIIKPLLVEQLVKAYKFINPKKKQ